ncbi:MAG: class II 3-deoxy-7-phosphoheptulonate synthase [Angustibacter sp.]
MTTPSRAALAPTSADHGLDNWRQLPAAQQPDWDPQELAEAVAVLQASPPLVFAGECDHLRDQLGAASRGEAFVLQGGDCAETFVGTNADDIRNRIKTVLQMAVVLTYGASVPVIKVGRMAGQFAKPRSSDLETRDGVSLPAYRGDAVNDYAFTAEARRPDPARLVRTYHASSATLNLIRAFTKGGFADLRQVHEWNRGFVGNAANTRYEVMAQDIDRAMRFMVAAGADFDALKTVDFYSSHEALLLEYERALTRIDSRSGLAYDVSSHFLWIGERTRQLTGAHLDLLSRVHNPIGVKLGPTSSPEDVRALIERLNPERIPGRLTFITRMGAGKIRDALPKIIDTVQEVDGRVLWICDPMHGNGFSSPTGYKTRKFDDIIDEIRGFFEVHRAIGTIPGGVHLELTGSDVTECLGGFEDIDEESLSSRYESVCDPRLNHQQALEVAFLVAEMLAAK